MRLRGLEKLNRDQWRSGKRADRRMNVIIGLALAATAIVMFMLGVMAFGVP
jgi:hypothetical protein